MESIFRAECKVEYKIFSESLKAEPTEILPREYSTGDIDKEVIIFNSEQYIQV